MSIPEKNKHLPAKIVVDTDRLCDDGREPQTLRDLCRDIMPPQYRGLLGRLRFWRDKRWLARKNRKRRQEREQQQARGERR